MRLSTVINVMRLYAKHHNCARVAEGEIAHLLNRYGPYYYIFQGIQIERDIRLAWELIKCAGEPDVSDLPKLEDAQHAPWKPKTCENCELYFNCPYIGYACEHYHQRGTL